jgi:hypothetical protein
MPAVVLRWALKLPKQEAGGMVSTVTATLVYLAKVNWEVARIAPLIAAGKEMGERPNARENLMRTLGLSAQREMTIMGNEDDISQVARMMGYTILGSGY